MRPPQASDELFRELQSRRTRQLSRGGQATVSLVLSPANADEIVVKEFRPAPAVRTAIEEERAALARLEALVDRREILGWTLHIPKVLAVSWQPPGLALTRVPGTSLDALIQSGWVPPSEISAVFAEVFQRYWRSCGQQLGDVNLRNLLCDPESRQLAIVDPGLPDGVLELPEARGRFHPASHDLGCLLHEVLSTNVLLGVVHGTRIETRLAFTRSVIEACVSACEQRTAFIDAIADCATAYLGRVSGGSAVHSVWRSAVRRLAQRALVREIERLKQQVACA